MKTTLAIEIFPIEDDGFHLKTTIKINGKKANVIIDTGASRSVFDQERIVHFLGHDLLEDHDRMSSGLGTNTMMSKKVVIEKLTLGDVEIAPYDATILDLSHVNASYDQLGLELIDGVLGSDIMNDFGAVIDYRDKTLILH